jgi:uncharacterized protein DUF5996
MSDWPALPYEEWRETRDTLHMYAQVVGKLRLAFSPYEPQWGHVPLYLTARGLSTSRLPIGSRAIDVELDLLGHELVIRAADGSLERRPLGGAVADFFADVIRILRGLNIDVAINVRPQEVSDPIPFPDDRTHDTYVPEQAARFFQALSLVDTAMKRYRAPFRGKTSPVQFFWGTFDLALARYSGRAVGPPPGAGLLRRVSGDAEQICAGWWPGDERVREASFFAYAYPPPEGIEKAAIRPREAAWSNTAGEFLLSYDAVRKSEDPDVPINEFLSSTYDVAARLLDWDESLAGIETPAAGAPR